VGGIDWATLIPAYLFQVLWLLALYALFGRGFTLGGAGVVFVLAAAALELVKTAIWILIVVVVVQAILSWVAPDGPLAGLLNAMTFPFLRPLRRYIPPIGGALDLTPLILIVLLQLVLILPIAWLERALPALLR
jgi:YggT family protein